jgi:hypothetical protein
MKFQLLGAEYFHADGRTDGHDQVKSRFTKVCEKRWCYGVDLSWKCYIRTYELES